MNISKFVLILLHSNTFCQLLLWSHKSNKREKLKEKYRITNYAVFWAIRNYFVDKKDEFS